MTQKTLFREFERIHDIRLPEELLRFYTEIGNVLESHCHWKRKGTDVVLY